MYAAFTKCYYRLLLAILLGLFASLQGFAISLYVGDRSYLAPPNPPRGGIFQTAWSSTSPYIELFDYEGYGVHARVTEYFTGIANVTCTAYYEWYDYSSSIPRRYQSSFTQNYQITCNKVSIRISPANLTIEEGEYSSVKVTLSPNISPTPSISIWSDDPRVVSVNNYGSVYAVGEGNTTIHAKSTAGPDEAVCYVTVRNIKPTDVRIPSTALTYVGETTSIETYLTPSNANTTFSWYCNPTYVATVSGGSVSGVDEGTATVYCVTGNGIRSNDCQVTVRYRTATGVKISDSDLLIPIGEKRILSWTPVPSNARTRVSWRSDDESVATVSSAGEVHGISEGSTTIYVTTDNGCSASCHITVPPNPKTISLPEKVSVYHKKNRTLKPIVSPHDAYVILDWKSTDPKVASVTNEGIVTAHQPGKTIITAETQNGLTASCSVEVAEPSFHFYVWFKDGEKASFPLSEHPVITQREEELYVMTRATEIHVPLRSVQKFTMEDELINELPLAIEISQKQLILAYNEKATLEYILYPEEYDIETSVHWESSDNSVATVNSNGELHGRHPGECTITATTTNGRSASCDVTVLGHEAYLVLWQHSGEQISYKLDTKPRIKYRDDKLWVVSDEVELGYPVSKVRKFTIESDWVDDSDGVRAVPSESIHRVGSLHYAKPGSRMSIYDATGRIVGRHMVGADGCLHYSLDNLPYGVYIIDIESITFKIIKK